MNAAVLCFAMVVRVINAKVTKRVAPRIQNAALVFARPINVHCLLLARIMESHAPPTPNAVQVLARLRACCPKRASMLARDVLQITNAAHLTA